MTCRESYTIEKHALLVFISVFLSPYDELFNIKQNFKMKKYMPLEGLRWSRDSGSALCDTPQNDRSRTGWWGDKYNKGSIPEFASGIEPSSFEFKSLVMK